MRVVPETEMLGNGNSTLSQFYRAKVSIVS